MDMCLVSKIIDIVTWKYLFVNSYKFPVPSFLASAHTILYNYHTFIRTRQPFFCVHCYHFQASTAPNRAVTVFIILYLREIIMQKNVKRARCWKIGHFSQLKRVLVYSCKIEAVNTFWSYHVICILWTLTTK